MDTKIDELKTKARAALWSAISLNQQPKVNEYIEAIDALIQARIEAALTKRSG